MVAMKSTFLFTLFALSAEVTATSTPACLLTAINGASNPADVKGICSTHAKTVQSTIASDCGRNNHAAQQVFSNVCSGAGVRVAAYSSSPSASHTKTHSSAPPDSTAGFISGPAVYTTAYFNSTCSCTMTVVTSPMATGSAFTQITTTAQTATSTSESSSTAIAAAASSSSSSGTNGAVSGHGAAAEMGSAVAAVIAVAGVVLVL